MIVSGLSGNEIYCLALKGYAPGEIAIGNSVCSLGVLGGLGAFGRGIAGGEVEGVTRLISEGRHQAIRRMEDEARKLGAAGVSGVSSELRTLAGYTEFLAQGTAVHHGPADIPFFSTASTGMQFYCHLVDPDRRQPPHHEPPDRAPWHAGRADDRRLDRRGGVDADRWRRAVRGPVR